MSTEKEPSQQLAQGETPEAWQAWEEYSKGLEVPPNPHAFAAGYKMAKDKYQPASQQNVDTGEMERVWNAALTLANNICVQVSDRYNSDDQIEEAYAANECAKQIRSGIGKLSEFADVSMTQQTPKNNNI